MMLVQKETKMFDEIINQVIEIGGLFQTKPITDAQMEKLENDLKALKIELPLEYAEFLYKTNGLFWGGLEFFGSDIVADKKHGYAITDLISQNKIYQALNPKTKKILLGRTDEENFIYNPTVQAYELVDEFSGEIIKTFPLFENLFEYILSEQIELIQNYVGFNEDEIKDEDTDTDF